MTIQPFQQELALHRMVSEFHRWPQVIQTEIVREGYGLHLRLQRRHHLSLQRRMVLSVLNGVIPANGLTGHVAD
jgi:hypothetical protein